MRIRWPFVCAVVCCCCVLSVQALDVASLKAKAESGDPKAQIALAQAYEKGDGVPQNNDLAAKWMRAAAEKGDPQAQNELGVFYRRGIGVEQDKAQAVVWYARSATQGYGSGRFNLAVCYYNGDGTPIDDSLAYAWFRLAAASGSKEAAEAVTRMESELSSGRLDAAKLILANIMLAGNEVTKDPAAAFAAMSEVADHGDREAQFNVGRMFADGIGVQVNPQLALKYLTASGTATALNYMADIYLQGRGVVRDPSKAVEVLEKASQYSTETGVRLARMYWDGGEVPQDYKKAVKHYESAASRGNSTALYWAGIAYRDGLGAKKDEKTSCMYFVVAANFGSPEAASVLQQACPGDRMEAAKKKAVEYIRANHLQIQLQVMRDRLASRPNAVP